MPTPDLERRVFLAPDILRERLPECQRQPLGRRSGLGGSPTTAGAGSVSSLAVTSMTSLPSRARRIADSRAWAAVIAPHVVNTSRGRPLAD
jgi:hypothetical protein